MDTPIFVKLVGIGGEDNIYINLRVNGGDSPGDTLCPHKKFAIKKNFREPIVSHMENYYLTLVTLGFPAVEVPLTIVNNIQSGETQTNPNLTEWSFCFTFSGNDYQEYVQYIPYNNLSVNPPSSNPPNFTQVFTNYYFVDNYNVLLDMFNTTLSNIYSSMWTANSIALGALGLTANDEPFFIYDSQTEKFSLIYNKLFIGNVDLFYSDSFSVYFPGFWDFYFGTNTPNLKDHQFIFSSLPNNEYDVNNNFNDQQYSGSGSYLNTINQIIITSNTLRTRFEYSTTDDSSQLSYSNIIFSLNPLLETQKESKSKLVYVTNGTYRIDDIISEGDIRQLDLNVFYTDNNGNIYDICIPKNFSGVMKLLFMKKTLKTLHIIYTMSLNYIKKLTPVSANDQRIDLREDKHDEYPVFKGPKNVDYFNLPPSSGSSATSSSSTTDFTYIMSFR
jgi:hypothetical protein